VASVLIGAIKMTQLEQNIAALSFEIPAELRQRLDAVRAARHKIASNIHADRVHGTPSLSCLQLFGCNPTSSKGSQ
jgi:hypothetical protein